METEVQKLQNRVNALEQQLAEARKTIQGLTLRERVAEDIPRDNQQIGKRKQVEESLRKSEERLRALISASAQVLYRMSPDWQEMRQLQGGNFLADTEKVDRNWLEKYIHPDDQKWVLEVIENAVRTGTVFELEHRVLRADGTLGWTASRAVPVLNTENEIVEWFGAASDITDRKRVEEALRESEEMLRLALTAGRAGAWKWDLTTDTLHWSEEYYRIFGFEPDSIPPSAKAGFSRIHPDDLPQIEEEVRQAVEHGTQIDTVHRVIWPDRSIHWVHGISQAFYNEQGKPDRMAGIAIDITEQKQADLELQTALRRNIEILESISDAFYSLDVEGRFTYINRKAASLWGKQPGELLGKNIWEVFPSGKETESYSKIQQTLADRQPNQYESYSTFLDQWIEVHLYPSEGGISVYFQDITNRKRAEAALADLSGKLENSNRELEQFAFVASHDLQEPLRKIEAFGDLLLESIQQADERARAYVERMRNAAGRMRNMVDGLLQLSRINIQGQPFVRVDLSKVASEVLSDLEHQVHRTGGKVKIGKLPVVDGDPLQLRQLVQNLIGNGLKYHRPNTPPLIKVHARQRPGSAQILFEDNGIGFDPNQVELMFQPFQRLVGRKEYEGSGMGLAICRKIVERHGGEITARGKPGEGSAFIVTLPVREDLPEEVRMDSGN